MNTDDSFGRLVEEIREEDLDLTQMELAKELGISQGALSKLEHGAAKTRARVFIALARKYRHVPSVRRKLITFLFHASEMDG